MDIFISVALFTKKICIQFNIFQKYQKTAVLFVLRSICKHNERLAEAVIKNGGLQTLVYCLEDFEPSVSRNNFL